MSDAAARAFADGRAKYRDGVTLRAVEASDREFLRDLYASSRAEELSVVPWPDAAKRQFLSQQFELQDKYYRETFADADYFVVLRDANTIGRLYVHRVKNEIALLEISILPQERGKGIGDALLRELIDEADATTHDITLHVEINNPAKRWYTRRGFAWIENRGVYDYLVRAAPKSAN